MSAETGAGWRDTQVSVLPGIEGRRWPVALAALVAAAALQIAAVQIAGRVLGRETVGAGMTPERRVLNLAPARQVPAEVTAGASTEAAAPAPPQPPRVAPAAPATRGADPVADPVAEPGSLATQRPFYEFREVDVPAEPVRDWNLDPASLDALATSRIVFTLFVASDGTPLHCSVEEPERLTAAVRRDLAERLCATAMRPARRGGVAVASRRRVELFTTGGF